MTSRVALDLVSCSSGKQGHLTRYRLEVGIASLVAVHVTMLA